MIMSAIYCFNFVIQMIITWSESKHMPSPSPLIIFFHTCLYYEHIISIGLEIRSIKAQRNFPSENLTELCLNLFSVCGSIGRKYSSVSIIFIIKQYLIMISFIQILFQLFPMWAITIVNRKGAINVGISQWT